VAFILQDRMVEAASASVVAHTKEGLVDQEGGLHPQTEALGRLDPQAGRPTQRHLARDGARLQTMPLLTAPLVGALLVVAVGIGVAVGRATAPASQAAIGAEQTTINVIRASDPSVVQIQGRGATGGSIGSGEILDSQGYIVTNDHVVRGLTTFAVLLATGQRLPAQLIGEAPAEDLAVVKVVAIGLKPITLGDSSGAQVGESVIALGSPLGLEQSATTGIVGALNRTGNENVDGRIVTLTGLIQTSAPINPGNSGGALMNLQGQLIGIPTLAAVDPSSGTAANGIGFAISSNRMKIVVNQLLRGRVVITP
jgi:S1-C subfamily serine protease